MSDYNSSISLSHKAELASLGIRQSPRGLIDILPTLGPSGKARTFELLVKEAAEESV